MYTVGHSYTARRDGHTFGPWAEGDQVDLTAEDAEWVNRDSPGTLTAAKREQAPVADRQHRGGRNRGT